MSETAFFRGLVVGETGWESRSLDLAETLHIFDLLVNAT